ncbi:MAG: ATP-binding protein [Polyangiaceae bacterium]
MAQLVQGSESLLRLLVGKNIRLEFELGQELPRVAGNAIELRQVLVNLVANAAEAQADRAGRVRVSVFADGGGLHGNEPYCVLSVADDGPGLTREAQLRLFDLNYSTKGPARGVGLAAVRRIVDDHRGSISLSTSPQGTLFEVRMPAEL